MNKLFILSYLVKFINIILIFHHIRLVINAQHNNLYHLNNFQLNNSSIEMNILPKLNSLINCNPNISHHLMSNDDIIIAYCKPACKNITIKSFLNVYFYYDCIFNIIANETTKQKIIWIDTEINNDVLSYDYYNLHLFLIDKYIKKYNNISIYITIKNITNYSQVFTYWNHIDLSNQSFNDVIDIPILNFKSYYNSNSLVTKCLKYVNTRKYNSDCMPYPRKLYQLLVTGLGGSGTHSVSNILRSMHIDVAHERLWFEGSVSWLYSVNNVLGRIPYPYYGEYTEYTSLWTPRYERVIHLIRCPMKQIASMTSHPLDFEYAYHYINLMKDVSKLTIFDTRLHLLQLHLQKCNEFNLTCLHVSAAIWLYWNQMVESYADATYKLENITYAIEDICNHFNFITKVPGHRNPIHKCIIYLNLTNNEREKFILGELRNISISLDMRQSQEYYWKMDRWEWMYSNSPIGHHNHSKYSINDLNKIDSLLANDILYYSKHLNYINDIDTCQDY